MKRILLILLLPVCSWAQNYQECREFILSWEGKSNTPYSCSSGNWTIGIGHKILPGERFGYINDKQIEKLFRKDLDNAIAYALEIYPNFSKHPKEVRLILIDMCFNLGFSGMMDFKDFRKAINKRQYRTASFAVYNSRYYYQTGQRASHHIDVLQNIR